MRSKCGFLLMAALAGNIAHAHQRLPTDGVVCSSLLAITPAATRGLQRELSYDLNSMQSFLEQKLRLHEEALKDGRFSPRRASTFNWSEPHNQSVFMSTRDRGFKGRWSRHAAATAEAVLGRIKMLQVDLHGEGPKVSFRLRGLEDINRFLGLVKAVVDPVENVAFAMAESMDPFLSPRKALNHVLRVASLCLFTVALALPTPLSVEHQRLQACALVLVAGANGVCSFRAIRYFWAAINAAARDHYENRRNRADLDAFYWIASVHDMVNTTSPSSWEGFAYYGTVIFPPTAYWVDVLEAWSKGDMPSYERIAAAGLVMGSYKQILALRALDSRRREVIIPSLLDLAFYFDPETHEPVLLFTVRRGMDGVLPPRRARKWPQRVRQWQGWGDLVPAR